MAFPEGDQHINELLNEIRHPDQVGEVPGVYDQRRPHSHSRGDYDRYSPDSDREALIEQQHQMDIQEALADFGSSSAVGESEDPSSLPAGQAEETWEA
ncbi:hypothetical protein IH980_05545 [Patescibacteria group bacterium]|nr:hypothetical protein [Patescibacteria group bacterium]